MNTSQSHQYTLPPSESSDEEDFNSIPDLVTPAEEMSPAPDHLNDSSHETQGTIPADVSANPGQFSRQG